MAKRTIITIGREFGSGGREIGQALASTLGIAYYDRELLVAAAKELIVKTDKKRAAYYNSYSDKRWGDLEGYHLTLDSSVISTDGAVELIKSFASMRK